MESKTEIAESAKTTVSPEISEISAAETVVFSASRLTSPATTAKPFPASPTRAASIAAFNASKFVFEAISSIVVTFFCNVFYCFNGI